MQSAAHKTLGWPTLQQVTQAIEKHDVLISSKILAIYPWGSRIYGTADSNSDWDYIVIIEDGVLPDEEIYVKPDGNNSIDKKFIVLEDGLINVTLIPFYEWRLEMIQHHHECMEVLFMDKQLVPLESPKLQEFYSNFIVDKDLLRRTCAWESKRRYTRAAYPARTGLRRGKKDLVHAMRYILFALQIFEHDKIVDYTAANHLYKQIVLDTESTVQNMDDFLQLMKVWEPKRSELSHLLGSTRISRRFYSRSDTERRFLSNARMDGRFDKNELDLIGSTQDDSPAKMMIEQNNPIVYIESIMNSLKSLVALEKEYPVVWYRDPVDPYLIQLFPQRFSRNKDSRFIQLIWNGAVLRQNNTSASTNWQLLSLGIPRISSFQETKEEMIQIWEQRLNQTKHQNQSNSAGTFLEELIDGTMVTLYFHDGVWNLASRLEPRNPSMTLSWIPISNLNSEISVNDAFWKIWKALGYQLPDYNGDLSTRNVCYTFIFTSNVHRHVVYYPDESIYLVHARNMISGKDLEHRNIAPTYGWKSPPIRPAPQTINELQSLIFNLNPLLVKGYGLKHIGEDGQTDFITLKNQIYVSIRYATDFSHIGKLNLGAEVDRKLLVDQFLYGTGERLVQHYPHWKPHFDEVNVVFHEFCELIDNVYVPHRHENRADFVRNVGEFEFCHTLYKLYQNNYPSAAEMFGLLESKQQHFLKPWRLFLSKHHPDLVKLLCE